MRMHASRRGQVGRAEWAPTKRVDVHRGVQRQGAIELLLRLNSHRNLECRGHLWRLVARRAEEGERPCQAWVGGRSGDWS